MSRQRTKLIGVCVTLLLAIGNIYASERNDMELRTGPQSVFLKVGDQINTIGGGTPGRWLNIENNAADQVYPIGANASVDEPREQPNPGWHYFDSKSIAQINVVQNAEAIKRVLVRMKTWPGVKEMNCPMDMELMLNKEYPCVFVRQCLSNLAAKELKLDFGNYVDIDQYAFDTNIIHEANLEPKQWHTLTNNLSWIWMKKNDASGQAGAGVGIISLSKTRIHLSYDPHMSTYRMFWGYNRQKVTAGAVIEYSMAVMTAKTPADVERVYSVIGTNKIEQIFKSSNAVLEP